MDSELEEAELKVAAEAEGPEWGRPVGVSA